MIAYKNGKPIGSFTEILFDTRTYEHDEIEMALKQIPEKKVSYLKKPYKKTTSRRGV